MPENEPNFAHRIAQEWAGIARHHKIFFVVAPRQHELAIDDALSRKRQLESDESDHVSEDRGASLCIRPMRIAPHPCCCLLVEFVLALMLSRVQSVVSVAPCMTDPIAHVAHNTSFFYVTWPKD